MQTVGDTRRFSCYLYMETLQKDLNELCERDIKRVEVKDMKHDLVNQNQLCFVHIFLILVCCRIATRIRIFYKACDEERLKSKLLFILLRIIYDAN